MGGKRIIKYYKNSYGYNKKESFATTSKLTIEFF